MMVSRQLRLFVPETKYYNLLKEFAAIDLATASVTVNFASIKESTRKDAAKTTYRQLQVEPALAQRFRTIVADTLDDLLDRLEDGGVVEDYQGGIGASEDVLEHLALSNGDRVADQIAPLAAPWDLEPFRERKEFLAGLRYYVVSLRRADSPTDPILHAFRFFTDSFQLHRTRWVATLRGHKPGYYDEVPEPGFVFDYQIDCLCRGDDMFILNRDKFQRIFRFYEYVQEEAKAVAYSLQDRIPIANLDEFLAACKRDPRMAMKLADLAELPHVQQLSMARIRRAIDRRGLSVEITKRDGKEMLVYATAYKTQFLRLLSDDYLNSPMTYVDYEVSSKRALKPVLPTSGARARPVRPDAVKPPTMLHRKREQVPDVSAEGLGDLDDVDE
ncbi:MAG: hypothetical protein OJF49_001055 [Ktedonobacterales bacterium]|jgi:hypothetical protein|nr:MAG: hypothetical protein OJF49_001055 [Ktedonobacterales bacterium]